MQQILTRLFKPVLLKTMSMRQSQLDILPVPAHSVLFLGDSITEQGMWQEWFPDLSAVNRGIGGDSVGGVLRRAGTALNRPAAISLLIGTNDLSGMGRSTKVADIADQLRELVELITRLAPGAPLVINSVMPRARSFAPRIRELNQHYREIAGATGSEFLDLWPTLADGEQLRPELSGDGLHLNGVGYTAWVKVLDPVLRTALGKRA